MRYGCNFVAAIQFITRYIAVSGSHMCVFKLGLLSVNNVENSSSRVRVRHDICAQCMQCQVQLL